MSRYKKIDGILDVRESQKIYKKLILLYKQNINLTPEEIHDINETITSSLKKDKQLIIYIAIIQIF